MKSLISEHEIMKTDEFFNRIHQAEIDYYHYWKEVTFGDWEFYLSIALSVIPWLLWIILRKRGSEARLLLVGGFVLVLASFLDFIGVVFGVWHYTGKALPIIPTYIPWDFCLIPVTTMLWVQFKPRLNPILKAIIYGLLAAFIGEPFFEWIGLYSPEKWNSLYSFIMYIVIYLLAYRISLAKTFDKL